MIPPSSTEPAANRLLLGGFALDLTAGELLDAQGELAGLRKQALDVLLVLGRQAGEVVSKDELMTAVWPNVVVGDGSLAQAIADIRRALGDEGHRLLRNVARRGYMLVPDRLPLPATEAPRAPDAERPVPVAAPEPSRERRTVTWQAGLAAALALVVLIAGGAWLAGRSTTPAWQSPADVTQAPLPREAPPLSIIVMPLTLEGEATNNEWLADALHGDLVTAVAQMQNSLVIARDTASTYKGKVVDPRKVARELGVRHVVRGSLRQEAGRIRLNLALIDGDNGVQRWAEVFDTDRAQLAQAVGDFAAAIERTLVAEIYRSTSERIATLSPSEVSADDLAMRGYALWYRGVTRENALAARALFDRALVMNPDSARAWGGVHFTSVAMLQNSWTDDRPAELLRSEAALANLQRLDRDGTYTYSAKAFQLAMKRDFPAMLRHTTEWIERYRLPTAFGALGFSLIFNGRFDEAVPVLERTLRLGPRDPFRGEWQYRLALAHFGAGRYELALDWSQTAASTAPALLWPPIHAAALLRLGRREAAQQAFDEHMRRHPAFTVRHVQIRVPSEPDYGEMRARLIANLRELGMRDQQSG